VPTAILGYVFHHSIILLFDNTTAVGAAFLVTGFVLFISKTRRQRRSPNFLDSILMGIAQGVALVPGISRSGVTIATGLLRGVKEYEAAELSFLMSIPAVLGVTVVETVNLASAGIDISLLVTSFAVAALMGYASIKILLAAVTRGSLRLFAYYCWGVGLVTILVSL
jgi:undecaprenyl-diphosphatase